MFPAVSHTDADANMLIPLPNTTLYLCVIKDVLVSISFKQYTSFLFNYLEYGKLFSCFQESIPNSGK